MKTAALIFIAFSIVAAVILAVTKQRGIAAQMAGGRTFRWPRWMLYVAFADLVAFVVLLSLLNT